jgi:hypothetical protein
MAKQPIIEKGIERSKGGFKGGEAAELLEQMEIGDSFLIKDIRYERERYYQAAHRRGMKISIRTQKNGMVRIWKVK